MDAYGKAIAKGEVVLVISGEEEASKENRDSSSISASKNLEGFAPQRDSNLSNVGFSELDSLKSRVKMSTFMSFSSPEILKFSQSSIKPPNRTRRLGRSAFCKPKSRFVEPSGPTALNSVEENSSMIQDQADQAPNSPFRTSPNNKEAASNTPWEDIRTTPITQKTPLMASPGGEEEDDEIYRSVNVAKVREISSKRLRVRILIEWIVSVCIVGCLIASLTAHSLHHSMIWGLEIWKWCVLVLVIVSGRLVTEWFIYVLVFLIERNFLFRKKVLYFVQGLKNSVQVCIWLGLVLLTWVLLFHRGIKRSENASKILNYVSRILAWLLTGSVIWLVKTLFGKISAASFHVNKFFDKIQESIFHQYVLRTISGPPLMELGERVGSAKRTGQLSFWSMKKGKRGEEKQVIDVGKLHKMKQEKVSAWTMKGLVNVITTSGLSTISNTIDQIDDEGGEQKDKEITTEWEAKVAAYQIFRNVAKPGSKYIDEEDLLRFLSEEEVDNVFPLFEGAVGTGKIKKSALRNWVVKVYLERKSLAHSLNDTKTAVKQLNKIINGAVTVVIFVVGLLIMGLLTTQVIVLISSQTLLVGFTFGNTAKTIFEAIIFVFVVHPFDVGDRCIIDGVQMVVEEMNILTTVFLRYDNEKIYYPNAVLATKPISNFYRSPDMGDAVEFSVDASTSVESIEALKDRVKTYIEKNLQYWHLDHDVMVNEIENVHTMKMGVYVTHTMNHQNFGEKNSRRSELVLEMKKIFEELSIKYHLLPQEVQVISYVGSASTSPMTGRR